MELNERDSVREKYLQFMSLNWVCGLFIEVWEGKKEYGKNRD